MTEALDLVLMSTTPHSPPQTPLKPTMAVDQENLTTNIQPSDIPMSNDPQRPPAETPSKTTKQSRSNSEVQVPSTLPHYAHGHEAVRQSEQIRSDPSDAQTEVTEDEPEVEMEGFESDHNAELPEMDWSDFQNRYNEAIMKANDEEQELLVEFEKYAEVSR